MIKIAFCDDDLSVLRELGALMDKYRVERNQDIIYASFNSPLELLTEVERGTRLDIIFLDVLMPAQNGISTAREIRQYDTSVKIIYLTSSAEYAVDSYSVGAYFYQLKPIWQESFYRLMVAERTNSDLANTLGNLVNRTISMSNKYFGGVVENKNAQLTENDAAVDADLKQTVTGTYAKVVAKMEELRVADALTEIFGIFKRCNKYIDRALGTGEGRSQGRPPGNRTV